VHQHAFDLLALGVAGWMRYVGGVDEQGKAIEVSDPLLAVIQQAVAGSAEGEAALTRCWVLRRSLALNCRKMRSLLSR
jgi:mannitol-1-phosphate/altronate dehydrogenase